MPVEEHFPRPALELWGGVECTQNRVREEYFEQLDRTGHSFRLDDLERFAELGIRALRMPVLWERVAPEQLGDYDWRWSDEWLNRLRELGIRPIVGLVHHGSGPRYTNLLDPEFPQKLAVFARAVAERYPWVEDFTPVNEPLTTARFSGLYGHWYPHGADDETFLATLHTQCQGVVLAMRAIREVIPQARLVQTDDLGKTFSTPKLRYQATFDNERRWLGFELLQGRVDKHHYLYKFIKQRAGEKALGWFLENPCPPDLIGLNYYLSSERFLDERVQLYPERLRGGNGKHAYADIEAPRVRAEGIAGAETLLLEAWSRLGTPLALTEVHNGCTREEQMRWFHEVWRGAEAARAKGADVRALTAWSLLGAFDWNNLVTRKADHYEPGVFDIRAPKPRATGMAPLLQQLANGVEPSHPVLASPGWWDRPERFLPQVPPVTDRGTLTFPKSIINGNGNGRRKARPILITGATGTLGRAFARICSLRGLDHHLTSRQQLDVADPASIREAIERWDPWAIINTAGYVRVDDAEADCERCWRENATGPALLAEACANRGVRLVTFSSDLVFDGSKQSAYVESDPVSPLNQYGLSKAQAERDVLQLWPEAMVVRTSAFFGPWDEYNFVTNVLRELLAGREVRVASDTVVSPTYVPDLVQATLDLLIDGEGGIWHLANQGAVTWEGLARMAAEAAQCSSDSLVPCATADFGWPAARPLYSVLSSERAGLMPTLESAVARFVSDVDLSRYSCLAVEPEAA